MLLNMLHSKLTITRNKKMLISTSLIAGLHQLYDPVILQEAHVQRKCITKSSLWCYRTVLTAAVRINIYHVSCLVRHTSILRAS